MYLEGILMANENRLMWRCPATISMEAHHRKVILRKEVIDTLSYNEMDMIENITNPLADRNIFSSDTWYI